MGIDRPNTPGGIIAVSDSTALATLDASGLPPGTRVFNAAIGSDFIYTISTAALDPDVVVEVFGTIGARWVLDAVGGGGGAATITGLDTSLMPDTNLFIYEGPLSTALPCDNMYPRAGRAIGFWNGTHIQTGPIIVTIKMTTDGGRPDNGAPVYVAGAIDDSNTGEGKCTAIRPIIATPFASAPPTNWGRSVNAAGICLSNSLYDSAKTVSALLLLPSEFEASTLPDQYWAANEFASLSNANYFKATGNATAGMTWQIGQTIVILFSVTDTLQFAGGPKLLTNVDAGFSKGWEVCVSGGVLQLRQVSVAGNTFVSFSGEPRYGLNCVAATIVNDGVNGQIRAVWNSNNGNEFASATIAFPIADPDATCSYRLGGPTLVGGTGWLPGSFFACGKLARPASDVELQNWASSARPIVPGPNRYNLPSEVEADLLLEYSIRAADWDGAGTMAAVGGPAGTGFNFTTVGTPTVRARSEAWFRNLKPLYLDTEPSARDTLGGVHTDPLARIAFTADQYTQEICVGVRCDNIDNSDNDNVAINTDGILTPYPGTSVGSRPDNVTRYHWVTIIGASTAVAPHDVEVIAGDKLPYNTVSLYRAGSYVESIIAGGEQVFTDHTTTRRLVIIGDDVPIGHDAGAACTPVTSFLRGDYPGRVTCHSATTRGVGNMLDAFHGDMGPWARGIIEVALEGSPTTVDLYFCLGWRDYAIPVVPLATFAADYADLIDQVRTLTADYPLVTWNFFLQNLIQDDFDATPNGDGDTLDDYNVALTALAAARVWLTFGDARVPNAITWTAAPGIYPSITAGQVAWHDNIKVILGY